VSDTTLPPVEEAYATLHQQVYAPAFFQKLASYGIEPETAEQATTMLRMGAKLRQAYENDQQQKQAGRTSFLEKAAAALDAQLGNGNGSGQTSEDQLYKAASAELAVTRPDIARAILSLQNAQ